MKTMVHIENPCHVSWEGMPEAGEGRHCGTCNKVVVDFRNKMADEISVYLEKAANRDACGLYRQRHTTSASAWEKALNRLEALSAGLRMRRVMMVMISCLLLLSSCHRRVVKGKFRSPHDRKAWAKHRQEKSPDKE